MMKQKMLTHATQTLVERVSPHSPLRLCFLLFFFLGLLTVGRTASAQTITVDGNPNDWPAVLASPSIQFKTHVVDVFNTSGDDVYQGSSADNIDIIPGWEWHLQGANDKTDIENAGAALIGHKIYFFGDRYSDGGTCAMSFWLFKNSVHKKTPAPNGFTAAHADGDLLLSCNFDGGGGVTNRAVYRWQSGALVPITLSIAAANVVANSSNVLAPWPYTPKSNSVPANTYAPPSFLEAFVDLDSVAARLGLTLDSCFADFFISTRTSHTVSATLEDLATGLFGTAPDVTVANDTVCFGQSAVFTAITLGGARPIQWSWNSTSAFGNDSTYTINPAVKDTFVTVIAQGSNGCKSGIDTGFLKVNPAPIVDSIPSRVHCHGATGSAITFTSTTPGTTFSWTSSANVGFGTSGTGSIGSYTATNTGTTPVVATVTVTGTGLGCTGPGRVFNVTVNPTPNVAQTGDSTYCNGASAPGFAFSGNVVGTVFSWTANNNVGFGTSGTGNIPGFTATNTTTATVVTTVIVTTSASSCPGGRDTFLVTVNPTPQMVAHGDSTYCNGASAGALNFTSVPPGATFAWTASANVGFGTSGTGNIPGYTATNTTTATIVSTVIVTPTANGCGGTADTFLITVNPTPHVAAHGDSTYCNGASAGALNFTNGVVGTTFTWTASANVGFGTSGTGNIPGYTATNTTTATVVSTVIVTPSASNCGGVGDTFLITVYPTPNVAAHGDSTYCNGASAGALNFTGDVAGTTFSWTASAAVGFGTSGTGNIPGYIATNTTTATIVSTVVVTPSASGCPGTADTFLITVYPTPNVAAHGDSTYCNGASAGALNFTGDVAGTTFSWTASANVGFGTSGTGNIGGYTATNTTTATIVSTVVVTPSANGCPGTADTFLITVYPTPNVTAHGDSTYCNGASAGGLNFTGNVAGTTFSWTASANVGFGVAGTGNIPGYTATNTTTATVVSTVVVTPSANGCEGTADTFLITVYPTPNVAAHGDSTYCNGASAGALNFTGNVAGTTFTWTASAEVGFGVAGTGNIPGYTATNTTTATIVSTVIVTPSANGCPGTADTFLITVYPTPDVAPHGDSTYCNGQPAGALNFTGAVAGTSFTWTSTLDVGFGTSGTGNIPAYVAANSGTVQVTATVVVTPSANGCPGTPDTFLIIVNPNPTVDPIPNREHCNGDIAGAINFTGGVPGATFQWSTTANVGFGTSGTGNIPGYTALNTGATVVSVVVTVSPTATGCPGAIATFNVTVNPTPTVVAHGDSTYCNGAAAGGLNFTGAVAGTLFTWSASAEVGFGTGGTGNIPGYTATNTTTATIVSTVIVTPTANGCTGVADTFLITVYPTPNVVAHGDSTYCNGVSAGGLNFTGGVAGTVFTWTASAEVGFGTGGTGNIPGYTATNTTTATIVSTVIVTPSANGCTGLADTFLITVYPTPHVNAHGDSTYCNGDAAGALTFTNGVAGTVFTWTASAEVGFGTSGTGSIPAYTATNNGTTPIVATVVVTPSANGCTGAADTFLITVNPTPHVNAHGDSTYCNGASAGALTFTNGVAGTLFTWTASANVGFGTSGTGSIPAYTATNNGTAPITATVVVTPSANGCTGAADTFLITVNPTPDVAPHGDSTYCSGQQGGPLNFTGGVAGTIFSWTSTADVGFGTSGTGNIPAYSAVNMGLVPIVATVVVTPSANGCTGTPDTFLVTVNPNPSINPIINREHCAGDAGSAINFSGSVPGVTFSWVSSFNVGFGTSGTGSIGGYFAANAGTTPVVATVTVTPSATGCGGGFVTFMVTVNPIPNVVAHGDSTYCNGASAGALNFTGAVAGTTFTWNASAEVGFGTGGTGNIPGYIATNTTTATIVSTVVVTPSANGCTGAADTFVITVYPTPHVAAHGDSTYCNGASAGGLNFTNGVAGTTFTWTASANVGFGIAGTGNIPGYTATNNTTATIVSTVIVTPSANGCTGAADTFLITVNPTPSVDAHADSTYCAGAMASGINFTGGIPGTTFSWTSTANVGFGTSGTGNIGAYVAVNAGLVPVVATVVVTPSLNGCTGTPDTFLITVNPNPGIDPVSNRLHCNGDAATAINFSGSIPGITFSWVSSTNVGFGTSGTGNIPAYNALNTGTTPIVATVTVTPSVSSCGGGDIHFMVTVNPTPDVNAHGDSTYCAGVTAPGLNFTGAVAGTTFVWTSSANVGFGTAGTGNIPSYTALNGGLTNLVATVIVTPSKAGCTGTPDTFLITVTPNPSIDPVPNRLHCNGDAATAINFSGSLPGITFSWVSSLNVGFGTSGTGNIPPYNALNTGTTPVVATVTVTPSVTSCGGGSITFMVTVNPTPNVVAHGDSTYCAGVLAPGLNFTGAVPGTTFNWTSSANVGFGTAGAGNIGAYTALNGGLVPIVATVIVTPSKYGCTGAADTFLITVNPNASINPVSNKVYCAGEAGTAINFSGSIPGITFTWVSSLNVGFGTAGTGNIGGYTALNGGSTPVVATVTVTPSVTGCGGGSITFLVTVNPTPNVYAHGDSTYCKGVTAPGLNFTGGVAGTAFAWTSSANVGFGLAGTGNIAPYLTLNPGSTNLVATVIVTPSKYGCVGTPDTFLIKIKPRPTVPYIGNVTLCSKAPGGPISITGGDVVNTYTWIGTTNVGFGTSGVGNIGAFTAINNPGPGNIVDTVTVSVTSTGGCPGDSRTFKVTILPKLKVVARDTAICAGNSLNLIPMGTPAGGTWSGPGVSGNTFNMTTPGTYKIFYNVTNGGGCSGYDSAYICVTECCVVYGTYTQGIWGACNITLCDGKTSCSGRKTPVQLINYLLSSGQIVVGRPGRSVIIPTYAAAVVNAVMPGSYGPNKLTYAGNVTISNVAGSIFGMNYLSGGKLKNSLLGEQIAMKLNIRMTPGLVNFPIVYTPGGDSYFQTFQANEVCCKFTCGNTCPTCFSIKKSVAKYLTKGGTQAANLNSLVNLADDLLGGVLTPGATVGGYIVPSYADVAAALGTVSSAFNYFRTFNGAYGCSAAKGAIASATTTTTAPTIESLTRIYPNPTTGAFTIEVPTIAKDGRVIVVDMNGRTIMSATLPANPYDQKLQLEMPEVSRGMYFIRIEVDGNAFAKKLMLE